MKASARALLALSALLVFLVGLALVFVFLAPSRMQTAAAPAATPSDSKPARSDGTSRTPTPSTAVSETSRSPTAADSAAPVDAPPLDDLFALLAWLEKPGHGPLPEVVGDAAQFDRYFAPKNRERSVDASPYLKRLHDPLAPGVLLQVEVGVWKLEAFEPQSGPFPPDVTLAGSGTNRTLLLLGGTRTNGPLTRFTLRDCTVFTDSEVLFDAAEEFASITIERARVIGFDSGLGLAPMIRARGLGIEMRDCEFAGGYGRAPGIGTMFEVPSAALLVRSERCKFTQLRLGPELWNSGASAAFVDCTAHELLDDPQAALAQHAGIVLSGTTFGRLAGDVRPRALEIDALFSNWRKLAR